MYKYKTKNRAKEEVCAVLFSSFLFMFLGFAVLLAFQSSGPIVLGTELNTNGAVEYMCLGNGCENLRDFRWVD